MCDVCVYGMQGGRFDYLAKSLCDLLEACILRFLNYKCHLFLIVCLPSDAIVLKLVRKNFVVYCIKSFSKIQENEARILVVVNVVKAVRNNINKSMIG